MIEIVTVKGVRSVEDQMRAVLEYLREEERKRRAAVEFGEMLRRLLMAGMTEDMRFSKPEAQEADECDCPICTICRVIEAREAEQAAQEPTTPQGAAVPSEAQAQEAEMKRRAGYAGPAPSTDTEALKGTAISNGAPKPGTDKARDILERNVRAFVPGTEPRELNVQALEVYSSGIKTLREFDVQTDNILGDRSKLRQQLVAAGLDY